MIKWFRNKKGGKEFMNEGEYGKYDLTNHDDSPTPNDEGNKFDYSSLADYSDNVRDKDYDLNKRTNKARKLDRILFLGNKLPNGKYSKLLLKRYLVIGFSIALFLLIICFGISREIFSQGSLGERAVYALYNFKNLEQIEEQLVHLESITTESVYKKIAVTNASKALNTYLKFGGKKDGDVIESKVEIINKQPGLIHYTIHSDALSDGRQFLFIYKVNWLGKICYVNEMEGIGFY